MTKDSDDNVGVAIALVCGAGAATALGASVVFFPSLVKLASKRVLASSLGISAGVMIYVSFVEIFTKSVDAFVESGQSDGHAHQLAALCFFCGVASMMVLDILVKFLTGETGAGAHAHGHSAGAHGHGHIDNRTDGFGGEVESQVLDADSNPVISVPHCMGCLGDPAAEVDKWHQLAEKDNQKQKNSCGGTGEVTPSMVSGVGNELPDKDEMSDTEAPESSITIDLSKVKDAEEEERKNLKRMGINTALAIAIHNFPEGLATFVAALDDPSVGAVLAIAIGIHNIPEGLCVALPIYYATGDRKKAFLWGVLSGVSEPVAALLGWAVLATSFSQSMYAVLFGLVSGMMVIISLKELLPTAHKYDPNDTVVTLSLIFGMIIIAVSLILFVA